MCDHERRGMTHQEVDDLFGSHKMDADQTHHFEKIKRGFADLAHLVLDLVPGGPMQERAIRKLFEAKNEASCGFIVHLQEEERKR